MSKWSPAQTLTRSSDPITSHLAAVRSRPGGPSLESAILVNVPTEWQGRASAFDLARNVEGMHPGRWTEGSVRTAVSRLWRSGALVKDGRALNPRGNAVDTFHLA